jgi:hypothetical protein
MSTDDTDLTRQITIIQEQKAAINAADYASSNTSPSLESIRTQKTKAFNAAYGDLQNNTNALHALYYYGLRDADLSGAQNVAINTLQTSANQLLSDKQLAKRQNEINQWTANNKLDTLFVYQQLLIILCTTIIMVYLMKRGLLSTTVFFIILTILALIFIFTVVNRVQYTNKLRNTQYWNKRVFEKTPDINLNICDTTSDIGNLVTAGQESIANISAGISNSLAAAGNTTIGR